MLMRCQELAIGACGLLAGVLGLGAVALAASGGGATPPPQAAPPPPAERPVAADAASEVRAAFGQDAWVEQVASLRLATLSTLERTPAEIDRAHRRLQVRHPGANIDADVNLLARQEGWMEFAFDRRRVWARYHIEPGVEQVAAFDGRRLLAGTFPAGPEGRIGFRIAREPGRTFGSSPARIPSLLVVPHRFWWAADPRDQLAGVVPEPEDFVAAGRGRFEGTECDVYCEWGTRRSLYVAGGRLRGVSLGPQDRPGLAARCAGVLRQAGFAVPDGEDYLRGLGDRERREAVRTLAARLPELVEPYAEFALDDYREVAPGRWFPFRQVGRSYFRDDAGRNTLAATNTIRITAAEVDRPLPDDLFDLTIPAGATVRDETADPPLTYDHKVSFTPAEWDAIVARNRDEAARDENERREQAARDEAYRREQAALIGRPAPEFPEGAAWLRGGPVRWAELAGRVVVLDFWAEWCPPCRRDRPTLAQVHRNRDANGLTIIGVHIGGTESAVIDKAMHDAGLEYPTCVDVAPPGRPDSGTSMFAKFGVQGFPHAVLVNREGRIAATGRPDDVLAQARELARPAGPDPGR